MHCYNQTPILIGCCDKINDITFDGCHYFCTLSCKHEIIQLDSCYQIHKKYCTCREYDRICYDWSESCFWASSKKNNDILFKLDCEMNEVDLIHIKNIKSCGYITGISYDCCTDHLIVSFTDKVISLNKKSGVLTPLYFSEQEWIMGIEKICNFYLLIVLQDQKHFILILDSSFQQIQRCGPYEESIPISLIFNPRKYFSENPNIEIFGLKHYQYPYICNFKIPKKYYCQHCPRCYQFCKQSCCKPLPCNDNSCKDITESIALVETAISHILNAEGEKIQKVLSQTNDIEKILCVNEHVNQTITHITHLEQILYDKLIAASNCNQTDPCCHSLNF